MNNIIFSEDMLYYGILTNSFAILTILEKKEDTKEVIDERKKVKRIFDSAFGLLLANGYKCTKEGNEGAVIYKMIINGQAFLCDETSLKNALFKDFNDVVSKALASE